MSAYFEREDTGYASPDVSIIIPALNEAQHIRRCMVAVSALMLRYGHRAELIVVDDGSTDDTANEAVEASRIISSAVSILRLDRSLGKGQAIAAGFSYSRGRLVGFIDADLEYPPEALLTMIALLTDEPQMCAVAMRARDERPWLERTTSQIAHAVTKLCLQLPVRDTQAGMKMFPGWFARKYLSSPSEKGWLYDIEALVNAHEHQLKILEIPVTQHSVRPRRAGLGAMLGCTPSLLAIIWNHWMRVVGGIFAKNREVIRFGMVGGANTLIDLLVYWVLITVWSPGHQGTQAALESLMAWSIASISAYFMHSRFTFRKRMPVMGFYSVTALGVSVQMLLSGYGTEISGHTGALWGKAVGVLLATIITYVGYHMLAHRYKVGGQRPVSDGNLHEARSESSGL